MEAKKSTEEILGVIKLKTKLCTQSRKNSNDIVDILEYAETEDKDILLACVRSFYKVFSHYLTCGDMYLENAVEEDDSEGVSKEEKYKLWLRQQYSTVIYKLVELLHHQQLSVQELSLCTLMKFITAEGQTPLQKIPEKQQFFPAEFFQKILQAVFSEECNRDALLAKFQEYVEYDDIRFHVLKFLLASLKHHSKSNPSNIYLHNVYAVLEQITFIPVTEDRLSNFLTKPPEGDALVKINSLKEQRKLFTTVWIEFLRFKLPISLYKKVLVILHEKVMPHLTNPLLLSDFLTDSYNIGGAISLLALNGLFFLVHKYNLEYPDFFKKFYALFEPSVFHAKYRARFFYLADLFLTSSHLPAYLVAAFAKKLARLSLVAPVSALTVLIPFIYNLINRHPSCKVLIHRAEASTAVTEDPYTMEEPDPAKCCALESSLWELKTLQSHYHPDISVSAKKIDHPLNAQEIDLAPLLEMTSDSLFDKEVKKKMKFVPITFERPLKGLLSTKDDKVKLCWTWD